MRVMFQTRLLSSLTLHDGHLYVFVREDVRILVSCSDGFSRAQRIYFAVSIKELR
jgi:hypothetical protein